MELKSVNLQQLKQLRGIEKKQAIEEYQDEKANLIQEYMRLQDIIDEYNDRIASVCCEIEKINIVLQELDE